MTVYTVIFRDLKTEELSVATFEDFDDAIGYCIEEVAADGVDIEDARTELINQGMYKTYCTEYWIGSSSLIEHEN